MTHRISTLAGLLFAAAAFGQTPTPPAPPPPATVPDTMYVRRFGGGASLSYTRMDVLLDGVYDAYDSTDLITTNATTTKRRYPLAGGVTFQYAFRENLAVSASAMYREAGYESSTTYYNGTDNSNTVIDERKRTIHEETTHAKFYEIPVLARWYSKSHYDPGVRWFVELGPTVRLTRGVRSTHRIQNPGNIVSSHTTPAQPANRTVMGAAGGFGIQLTDPFGIHYLPEVRYTRWMKQPFNSLSTQTYRHQLELVLSVTF